jgi:catechol 2,3-dioxygenase-like lactoylglutathione lyase family enzyme
LEIKGLQHVNIVVQDVDVARKFYCDILGMEEKPRHPSFQQTGAWLHKSGAEIHLVQVDYATHPPGDLSVDYIETTENELSSSRHFCLEIDDTDSLVRILEKNNISIVYGPITRTGGLIQTYCYDPDNHLIEFSEFPK